MLAEPRREPIDRIVEPFRDFTRSSATGSLILLAATIVALTWANSAFADSYFATWQIPVGLQVGSVTVDAPLLAWVNEGLMAVFFLLVGLEIKRELLVGELVSRRRAILPLAAAVGGSVVPALIFIAVLGDDREAGGWGIPMATDIAFALGVLALLGRRVPVGLKIFVTALAIADDLIAVLVIGFVYSGEIEPLGMLTAALVLVALAVANWLGVRAQVVYGGLGFLLWLAVVASGIHGTVAGVLVAAAIPARPKIDRPALMAGLGRLSARLSRPSQARDHPEYQGEVLGDLERVARRAQVPMLRIEHRLRPWVTYLILPLFALANAGVALDSEAFKLPLDPLAVGIFLGLVIGKQVGIGAAAWLVVRTGLGSLPDGVTWRHIYGAAWLGGIGFTMSLFIAGLGLGSSDRLDTAKVAILAASVVAGLGGYLVLRFWAARARPCQPDPPRTRPALHHTQTDMDLQGMWTSSQSHRPLPTERLRRRVDHSMPGSAHEEVHAGHTGRGAG